MQTDQPVAETGSLRIAIGSCWALLLGFGVLTVGDGLQGALLPLRAAGEQFATATTGLIMSTFYAGFLVGSVYAPRMVGRVGHVRVFAALASIASAVVLIHSVFVSPSTWVALRLVSGFCFAGLYVVAESWLNDRATNETRGQLLSVYMVVGYVGAGGGALLLNVASPSGYGLFILTSVLISIALVPLLLSARTAPRFEAPNPITLRELFRITPLGVVGTLVTGATMSGFYAIAPLYAQSQGLSVAQISIFLTAAVIGAMVFQWPIGHLSDVLDRRGVLTVTAFVAAALSAALALGQFPGPALFGVILLYGGVSLPIYSLCLAHANDYLERDQMVGASAALVLAGGVGSVFGPITAAGAMQALGPSGFAWFLAVTHAGIAVFAVYRMTRRPARPPEAQGPYSPAPSRASLDWNQSVRDQMEYGEEPRPD